MANREAMHRIFLQTGIEAHRVAAFNIFREQIISNSNFTKFLDKTAKTEANQWRHQCSLFLDENNEINIDFDGSTYAAARNTRRYEIINFMMQFIQARRVGLVVRQSHHGADGLNYGGFLLHDSPIKNGNELVFVLNLLASTYVTSSSSRKQAAIIREAPQSDFPSLIEGDGHENTVTFLLGFLYFLNHHADAAIGMAASATEPLQLLDNGTCKFCFSFVINFFLFSRLLSSSCLVLYDSCDDCCCSEILIRYDSRDALSFADTVSAFGAWIDSPKDFPSAAKHSLPTTNGTIRKRMLCKTMAIESTTIDKPKPNKKRRFSIDSENKPCTELCKRDASQ